MKQLTPQPKNVHIGRLVMPRKLFTLLCICVAIVGSYLFVDYLARQHFSNLKDEMGVIDRTIMQPAGAAEQHISFTGEDFFSSTGCIDVECPSYRELWVVPIEHGQEAIFADSLLEGLGYGPSPYYPIMSGCSDDTGSHLFCFFRGRKDKFDIEINIQEADNFHHKIPARNVSPKVWRVVDVSLNFANGQ